MQMASLSILPVSPVFYAVYERLANAVLGGNFSRNASISTDRKRNVSGNLRQRVCLGMKGWRLMSAPFCGHIGKIFCLSSKPKMVWVYALTIVARVANNGPLRDAALISQIGVPMRPRLGACTEKHAITIVGHRAGPFPTAVCFVEIAFEIRRYVFGLCANVRSVASVATDFTRCLPTSPRMEGITALSAVDNDVVVPTSVHTSELPRKIASHNTKVSSYAGGGYE